MRPVSAQFLETLTGSHTMAVRVRAVEAGQTGVNPTAVATLLTLSGDVQLDAGADIRANLDLEISATDPDTGENLWPDRSDSTLTLYGAHEIFAERGIAYGGGSIEYVSLGYFRIDNVEQDDAPDGPIKITGSDRMSMIVDSMLTEPIPFVAADTYGEIVEDLVLDAYGAAVIEWDDDTETDPIGRSGLIEDRYGWIKEALTGVGKVAYFDHRGILVIKSAPSATLPVWTVARGERGVLVSAGRSLSREGVYNGVLATGESIDTEPPVRALAVDTGADSPTLWGGPFGKIAREFASPLLTSTGQCELAAQTVLRRSLGLPYNVDLSAIPNPALEPDDPIIIGFEGVPDPPARYLKAGDSFTRTVAGGWGTSETGNAWNGLTADCAVASGVGQMTIPTTGIALAAVMSTAAGLWDVDVYADIRVPLAPITVNLITGIVLRYKDASNYLMCRLDWHVNGTVTIKLAEWFGGVFTTLDEIEGIAPYVAGDWWTIRARADNDTVKINVWSRDSGEGPPDGWIFEHTLTHHHTGVRYGLYGWRPTSNANTTGPQFEYDNLRAYPAVDLSRNVGEVHIIDTLTIPLTAAAAMSGRTREQSLTVIGEP
jgi:hypothetical protein